MSYTCSRPFIPLLVFFIALTSTLFAAAESLDVADTDDDPHVRTTDRQLATFLAQGIAVSPYFRELVARLNNSDVVVYMQTDRLLTSCAGRMTFLATGGGRRYVVVTIAWGQATQRSISTMAHELRHAIEVAEDPHIIDAQSLGRAYERIGFRTVRQKFGIAYDTHAALAAGDRVWQELSDSGSRSSY